ncbi:MAG: sigma 54-interacting transcriptional regulator, partial [Verrucomicrobia bacterium]|nr:sigma 54-interacting transcriptional regulator [Verrucomicrobiota bacterium]
MSEPIHPKPILPMTRSRSDIELEMLHRISSALTQQHDISSLLDEVLEIMESEMELSRGTLTLRKLDSDVFSIEASRGLTEEERKLGQYKLGEGITGKVAQTGKPAIVKNVSLDPQFLDRTKARGERNLSFICVPIIHLQRVIGTMSIDRPIASDDKLRRDQKFLLLVASLLAEGVSRIRTEIEERESLLAENRKLRLQLGDRYSPSNMVGNCSSMRHVYEQIAQVANSTATVLVRGESGTGKELVSRAIHHSSARSDNAFVSVNCAALPENLIESEL